MPRRPIFGSKPPSRATDALRRPDTGLNITLSGIANPYSRTEPDLASIRALYNGTDTRRPLGSFMAAPVIDLLASYIGMPRLVSDADDAPEAVALAARTITDNSDKVLDLHRAALRDGSAWLLVGYERPAGPSSAPPEQGRLSLEALPRDTVRTETDPATGELISAEILRQFTVRDGDQDRLVPVIQAITPKQISYRLPRESQSPPRSFRLPASSQNPWGFVPLVRFVNEPGAADSGLSELERIEPYMQLYHDALWAASQGSRMHSTPKLAFSLEDPTDFIRTNFGQAALDHPGGEIRVTGTEAFFLGPPDKNKASYLEAANPIGSAVELLRLLFYCMIIASGTPEYALGVHMSSSCASTKEQAPHLGAQGAAQAIHLRFCLGQCRPHDAGRAFKGQSLAPCQLFRQGGMGRARRAQPNRDRPPKAGDSAVRGSRHRRWLMSDRLAMETLRSLFPDMRPYDDGPGGGEAQDAEDDADRRRLNAMVADSLSRSASATDGGMAHED